MKIIVILFFTLLLSCTSNNDKDISFGNFNTLKEMSFDEFKSKLDEYADNNPYPNIDDKNE
tara:strand:- start:27 stop:209 length:183 start_codon:yes stop_codon:yes gene_type:complete